MSEAEQNLKWASDLVAALARRGVSYYAMASGSRNSPLVLAAARHPGAETSMHLDERAVAFQALGHAKATGRPAAVITTSGTAVANLLPAVVEASQSNTPLILLTADRPVELRGTGANQTIDQVDIFGTYARWFVDLPPPGPATHGQDAEAIADRAVRTARTFPGGPVHMNLGFREPLLPGPETLTAGPVGEADVEDQDRGWFDDMTPWLEDSVRALADTERGLVVVGTLPTAKAGAAVSRFTRRLGWPVFADITSGLRLGAGGDERIACSDALLQEDLGWEAPDTVLHLGGPFVSKRLAHFLAAAAPVRFLQVCGPYGRFDPDRMVTRQLTTTAEDFCRSLLKHCPPQGNRSWLAGWQTADRAAGKALDACLGDDETLSEPLLARRLSTCLPPGHSLMLGNSLPVRDMNTFASTDGPAVRVVANRGASGIDGNLATAEGYARGAKQSVTLVLGDLALLHDLTSLRLVAGSKEPVIVIVVNNDGGGIFQFLPVARHVEVFEPFFGTPHGLHFEDAARQFGLRYAAPDAPDAFAEAYRAAIARGESALLEVVTDRAANVEVHERLLRAVNEAATA